MASPNIAGLGTTFSWQNSGSSATTYTGVTSISPAKISMGNRDVTSLGDTSKQYQPTGLPDADHYSITFLLTYTQYGALYNNLSSSPIGTGVLTYKNGDTETFVGFLDGWERGEITPEGTITATASFKVSGLPTYA